MIENFLEAQIHFLQSRIFLQWLIVVFIFNCSKLTIVNKDDLENLLLYDCLERIQFTGNISFYFRDGFEGYASHL